MANSAFTVAGTSAGGGSGALTFIQQQTVSAVSSVNFSNLNASFTAYVVIMTNISHSTTANLQATFNNDTTAGHYEYCFGFAAANNSSGVGTFSTSASNVVIYTNSQSAGSTNDNALQLYIYNPGSSGYCNASYTGNYYNSNPNLVSVYGSSIYKAAGPVTSVQLLPSAGTISGTFTLYGINSNSAQSNIAPKAFITYSTAGGSVSVLGSSGNVTAAYNSTGNVTLTFASGVFANANYTGVVSLGNGTNANGYSEGWASGPSTSNPTSTSYTIQTKGSTGAAQESYFVNAVFFSN